MKISDSERREVAARLRESREFISCLPKTTPEQNAFDTFELILACVGYEKGNLFDHLADLIDRPTCKNLATHLVDELVCSACGERVDIAYLDSDDDYRVRYCPSCGAKVVDE